MAGVAAPAERALHNALDADFQQMLYPLNLMQIVLFQPKYRILHGFVTPNGFLAHLHCSLGVLLVLAVNFYRYWVHKHDFVYNQTAFQSSIYIFDSVFYTAYSVFICAVNAAQSRNNVRLVLRMQRAHRLLAPGPGPDGGAGAELARHRDYNWLSVGLASILYIGFVSCIYDPLDYSEALLVASLFYFDSNMIFALQVLWWLERATRRWLRALARFGRTCAETDHTQLIKYFKEVDLRESELYQAYLDILEAFKLYRSIFQWSILLLAVELFVHPLIYIQSFLEVRKGSERDADIANRVLASLWVAKNLALLVAVSAAGARARLAVAAADEAGAVARCRLGCLENIRKLCKKVCRLNAATRAARDGWGAAGVAGVAGGAGGAALPLRLLALLVTYTVVLLQFAFL